MCQFLFRYSKRFTHFVDKTICFLSLHALTVNKTDLNGSTYDFSKIMPKCKPI